MTSSLFNDFSSLCELIGNSIDARARDIVFKTEMDNIRLIDNGVGMNEEKAANMFDLCRANHTNDKSIGISGKGAKGATLRLSKEKETYVFTSDGTKRLKITVPWDKIMEEHRYSKMITIETMSDDEWERFKSERESIGNGVTGTTIVLPSNHDVYHEILDNFSDARKKRACNNRFDTVFGKFMIKMSLIDVNNPTNSVDNLDMYNYFSDEEHHYYNGGYTDNIIVYKDRRTNSTKIVWQSPDGNYYIMKPSRGGISNTPSIQIIEPQWEYVGEFTYKNALRKDDDVFNQVNPSSELPCKPPGKSMGSIDDRYFDCSKNFDTVKADLSKCGIIRNNHRINDKSIDGFKASSSRADHTTLIRIAFFRTELSYFTVSSQNNLLDDIIGVQSNKNQLNSDGFPKEFMRLLSHIKNKRWEETLTYFSAVYNASISSSESEEDTDIESESESEHEVDPVVQPEQPEEVVQPEQPEEVIQPEQPEEVVQPEQPEEVVQPEQPEPEVFVSVDAIAEMTSGEILTNLLSPMTLSRSEDFMNDIRSVVSRYS